MKTLSMLIVCLQVLQVLCNKEDDSRMRRGMGMLRMGKRDMALLRLGRSFDELPPLVPDSYNLPHERDVADDEYNYDLRFMRAPPMPRLGVDEEYLANEIRRELGGELRQVYMTQPRVGRYLESRKRRSTDDVQQQLDTDSALNENDNVHTQVKRSLPRFGVRELPTWPRLGLYERSNPFSKIEIYERAFPRLGVRDENGYEVVRSYPFPRLGLREEDEELVENERAFPRFGVRDLEDGLDEEKRAMSMLRMGKRDDEAEKRAMGMLRMGRGMSMLRMGKRAGMSMLRMGRSLEGNDTGVDVESQQQQHQEEDQVRTGRSTEGLINQLDEKRAMGMLRMGRAMPLGMRSARGMSMLRMGRSDPALESTNTHDYEKREMSMLRMGKRDSETTQFEKKDMGLLRMG